MTNVTDFPVDRVSTDELTVQLWELAMAGERGSAAFMRIDAQLRSRNPPERALRRPTFAPSASHLQASHPLSRQRSKFRFPIPQTRIDLR